MTQFKTSTYLELRLNLFHELINSSKQLLLNISNNNFDLFSDQLMARNKLFHKINELDKKNSTERTDTDTSSLQVFLDLDEEIKRKESDLITAVSLKIQQLGSEYENKAKGLLTLKGYKNTYFSENKETIGIV